MTNDEIRIAIAEDQDYEYLPEVEKENKSKSYDCRQRMWRKQTGNEYSDDGFSYYDEIPNYPEDLNAVHEVEKTLSDKAPEHENTERELYALELLKLVATWKKEGFTWGDNCDSDYYKVANATAHQRAEAYLRTKGLWK